MKLQTNIAPHTRAATAGDDALTALAAFVKLAINSSLSVDELKALGRERLEDFKARAKPQAKEFDGYSINNHFDADGAAKGSATAPQRAAAPQAGVESFAGYSINQFFEEAK